MRDDSSAGLTLGTGLGPGAFVEVTADIFRHHGLGDFAGSFRLRSPSSDFFLEAILPFEYTIGGEVYNLQ